MLADPPSAAAAPGGSFAPALGLPPVGGHNPLEPARLGKPAVAGPDASNWSAVTEGLAASGGLKIVAGPWELAEAIAPLLADPAAARAMVERARRAAAEVEYTDAVAALAKLERELGGGESRARIELASAVAARDLAAKRAAVFERQRALFEKSFAEGNTALADLIRARTLAFQAAAARERADVGAHQARGRLNQALGLMP